MKSPDFRWEFIDLMEKEFVKEEGYWTAPLPFRQGRPKLPDNKPQTIKRTKSLDISMSAIIKNGHAEIAPPLLDNQERWYLPIFGVYHSRKPNQIRGTLDSSAKHCGFSLNDVLLSGTDLINSLIGVLMRFRQERIAIMTDVQQMFYCFPVANDHEDFLRFLWYYDNDHSKDRL